MANTTDDPEGVQAISPYQWIRLIVTFLLIPVVLLVSAWDFAWWQAWVFSVLMFVAGIGDACGQNDGIRGRWRNENEPDSQVLQV